MTMSDDMENTSWHLDKRVPVAVIMALVGNIVASVWWLSALGQRVEYIEMAISTNEAVRLDIAQVKERINGMDRVLMRLEAYLDGQKRSGSNRDDPR